MDIVYPNCCEEGKYISLQYKLFYTMDEKYFLKTKPEWYLYFHEAYNNPERGQIDFCPFCGTKVPELELRLFYPEPIFSTKDGFNCLSCNGPMKDCECFPPEIMWKLKE